MNVIYHLLTFIIIINNISLNLGIIFHFAILKWVAIVFILVSNVV